MGEQYGPGIADPIVKADIAFGCLRLKIRRGIIDCKSHDAPPSGRATSHRCRYFDTWPRLLRLSRLSATSSNVNLRREATCARKPQLELHVRLGSKADIEERPSDVRFTPKSGHRLSLSPCPLCATFGHTRSFVV